MIHEYHDGRIVCLDCAGVASPVARAGAYEWDEILDSYARGEKLPETDCEHVRRIRRGRWEAEQRQAREAGDRLATQMMLQAAFEKTYPDEELVPGPPPEWMVA